MDVRDFLGRFYLGFDEEIVDYLRDNPSRPLSIEFKRSYERFFNCVKDLVEFMEEHPELEDKVVLNALRETGRFDEAYSRSLMIREVSPN